MRPEAAAAASAYALALPSSPFGGGRAGERIGRGTGSSLEFMDFRDYLPGDDLRHVDWRSYARTDQMKIRLYREEIAPVLDVVVDGSASMAVSETKRQATLDICAACAEWMRAAAPGGGTSTRWIEAGRGTAIEDLERLEFAGDARGLEIRVPLRARGLRLVISDFLCPDDPLPSLRKLAARASHVWVVQLLDPRELDPSADGPRTLVDVESGERLELELDRRTIDGYRERLTRLRRGVEAATRRVGGTFASVTAADPARMFRGDLLRQGVLEPR